jgi:hypothetical protein
MNERIGESSLRNAKIPKKAISKKKQTTAAAWMSQMKVAVLGNESNIAWRRQEPAIQCLPRPDAHHPA